MATAQEQQQKRIQEAQAQIAKMEAQLADPTKLQAEATRLGISAEETRRGANINIGNLRREIGEIRKGQAAATQTMANIERGREVAQQFIQEGSLGRLEDSIKTGRLKEGQFQEGKSEDIADIIARRREALSGLSGEEQRARRDIALQEIGRSEQLQQRQAQSIQAQQGVRGGVAAAQQLQILQEGLMARSQFERDLFLENERVKREALDSFERSVSASEATEMERKAANIQLSQFNIQQQLVQDQLERERVQFNMQQAAKERFGQAGTALGFAQLVQSDVAGDKAIAAQQAAAAAASGGGK